MDHAESLWIGDALVQQDMGGDGEWGDDAFDAASNAIVERMKTKDGTGPDISWVWSADTHAWRDGVYVM